MRFRILAIGLLLAPLAGPAFGQSARELLTSAAFTPSDKATALGRIDQVLKSADAALAHNPGDKEAQLQQAMATSYRGKLTKSRSDTMTARHEIEAAVAADPRNAEAQMALAGWHLGAVIELGPFMARTMLGARTAIGLQALDSAVKLGGDHAFFPAVACLHRIQIDPADVPTARRLADAAVKAGRDTPLDKLMQKQVATLLPLLRVGNGKAAALMAKQLLPFGLVN